MTLFNDANDAIQKIASLVLGCFLNSIPHFSDAMTLMTLFFLPYIPKIWKNVYIARMVHSCSNRGKHATFRQVWQTKEHAKQK